MTELKIIGSIRETADFRLMVPENWEFVDFGISGLQAYNSMGTYIVSLKKEGFNMTEQDEAVLMASFVENNKGSHPVRVEFKGLNWLKTAYYSSGMHQTLYTAVKEGRKVSIVLSGPDHENNDSIQAIMGSVEIL
jgi:hypothetical protein